MAETKSLKEQNAWLIRAAMIAHIAAFAWIALEPGKLIKFGSVDIANKLETIAIPGSASLGLIVIASLLLLGLIPPLWRDRIIHLRWKHPLPGSRAFTEVGPQSNHIDMKRLSANLGGLPTAPAEQNQIFYRLYSPLRDDVGVCDAHRRYLAARDIGTISFILIIPLPILSIIATNNFQRAFFYSLSLLIIYFLCCLSAKNYSWRMVQHVLALSAIKEPTITASPMP